MKECSLVFSAPAPLAPHFTLPSRACMSQTTTKDPSCPEAYWKDSQGGCAQSSQGSLVVQKCMTSVFIQLQYWARSAGDHPRRCQWGPRTHQVPRLLRARMDRPSELSSWQAGKVWLMLMPHSCICAHAGTGTCHTHVKIWTHMYAHTYVQHVHVHASIYEQHTQAYLLTHVCVLIHTYTGTHTNTHVSVHTPSHSTQTHPRNCWKACVDKENRQRSWEGELHPSGVCS